VTASIDRLGERLLFANDDETVEFIDKRRFAAAVRHRQQLEMIQVVRFERLIAHFEPNRPVRGLPDAEPIDITAFEYRRDAVGECFRLQLSGPCAVRVYGRTGAKNRHRERCSD